MSVSYHGNKIFSFYHDGKQLKAGKMVIPRFVSIWLTTACDLSCSYCYCKPTNDAKFIDTESLKRFMRELSVIGEVESIEFSGGGEPTLHPDCYELAEYANNLGFKVGLLTNGFILNAEKSKIFEYIRIGLDAHNAELYQAIKGNNPGRFQSTIKAIKRLIVERKEKPLVGLKFMINKLNYDYIPDMAYLSKNLEVDYCHFKGTHSDVNELNQELTKKVEEFLLEYKKDSLDFIIGSVLRPPAKVSCFMSPIHTVITPNGDCLPCCYHNTSEYFIGNIFKDGFLNTWFSPRHWEVMDSISIEMCGKVDCRWNFYNAEMYDILTQGKYDLNFI